MDVRVVISSIDVDLGERADVDRSLCRKEAVELILSPVGEGLGSTACFFVSYGPIILPL